MKQYVEGCDQCQKIKNRAEMPVGKLRPNEVPEIMAAYIGRFYYKVTGVKGL